MSDITWMFIAFMAVWIGIGAYLLSISVRQRRIEKRLESLAPASGRSADQPQV
jgi:CcmD family protein